jgi:hypothetical protein
VHHSASSYACQTKGSRRVKRPACIRSTDCIESHIKSSRARRGFLRRIGVCNLEPTKLVESGLAAFG